MSLSNLPLEVLSQILSNFCDGKSISTFGLIVARGDPILRESSSDFIIVRDALVHRYKSLAEEWKHCSEEMKDVLDVIREDIRTFEEPPKDNPTRNNQHAAASTRTRTTTTKFSEWCAVVDYFDSSRNRSRSHRRSTVRPNTSHTTTTREMDDMSNNIDYINNTINNHKDDSEWMIWCGPIETNFGTLQARITTISQLWTPSSLQYWYQDIELAQFSLERPPPTTAMDFAGEILQSTQQYYAKLETLRVCYSGSERDREENERNEDIFHRLQSSMSPDVLNTFVLVPSHMIYETTLGFTLPPRIHLSSTNINDGVEYYHNHGDNQGLACYWDSKDNYDWEDSIDRLGENVIRIMQRCCDIGFLPNTEACY